MFSDVVLYGNKYKAEVLQLQCVLVREETVIMFTGSVSDVVLYRNEYKAEVFQLQFERENCCYVHWQCCTRYGMIWYSSIKQLTPSSS